MNKRSYASKSGSSSLSTPICPILVDAVAQERLQGEVIAIWS